MKNSLLFLAASLLLLAGACNKNSELAPVYNGHPYVNAYAGTYNGLYEEQNNGVDSNGVFKHDTSYSYSLKIIDGGNYTITINHGPIFITAIPVDSNGNFYFQDYNHNINGYFTADSLIISSDALNGYYDPNFSGDWFVIQKLSFKGKKQL